jgi:uncharacterized protein
MSPAALFVLLLLFVVTSAIGVVTGSNSLITVPVMFQFGIDEKVAIATNMFGLTFMAIGATIPFLRAGKIDLPRVTPLIVLTLIGSALGAVLVGIIANQNIRLVVSTAMIVVGLFILFNRDRGVAPIEDLGKWAIILTWVLTFALGIYGGLYSGGYVTLLTAVYVAFFGMTYSESIAATKLINVFSSGIATLVFMWQGLVDYKLGLLLAAAMFAGALVGAHYVIKMNDVWLRRIFLSTVILLAIKTLYDLV